MNVASPLERGTRAACAAIRAALASHFANRCQNHSGSLSTVSLCSLMMAAPTAAMALTAPALMALKAAELMISSRVSAAAARGFPCLPPPRLLRSLVPLAPREPTAHGFDGFGTDKPKSGFLI